MNRVTDEQARQWRDVGNGPYLRSVDTTVGIHDLASDLLEARAEIDKLRGEIAQADECENKAQIEIATLKADRDKLRAGVDDLEDRMSRLLDNETCGRMSNPNYDVETMVAAIDEYHEKLGKQDIEAATKELRAEVEADCLLAFSRVVLAASERADHGHSIMCPQTFIDPKPCTCGQDALVKALAGEP